jgi:hypothetical protein
MSDSEGAIPSEAAISQKLRDVVISIHKTAKPEDLTVKRVRVRAEKELSLPDGFLKKDPVWKQKSQDTILAAVVSMHLPYAHHASDTTRTNTAQMSPRQSPPANRVQSLRRRQQRRKARQPKP